jgi:hypothetical protein
MPFSPIRLPAMLLGFVLLATPSVAQEPTPGHLAIARELVSMTGTLSTVDGLIPSFAAQVRQQAVTRPDLTKDLEEVLKSLQPELEQRRQQIINAASRVYAKHMTEAETKDVVAFFKTPSGSKYIKIQPQLIDDIVETIQAWGDQVSEFVISRARAEMMKRGHQLQ